MPTDKRRVAVIGSGFGGLAVAIRLQAAGCKTVIFEKRDRPGGRAYVYHDHGFTFDAGPTVITAPDCLRELFSLAGKSMDDYITLLPVKSILSALLGRRIPVRLLRRLGSCGKANCREITNGM